jgi:hypothetical protein
MPPRQLVPVEHHLLRRIERAPAPGKDRIFRTGLVAPVIPIAILEVRDADIVLLHTADNLAVECIFKRTRRGHASLPVFILRRQVGEHLRIAAPIVTHPVIRIAALAPG